MSNGDVSTRQKATLRVEAEAFVSTWAGARRREDPALREPRDDRRCLVGKGPRHRADVDCEGSAHDAVWLCDPSCGIMTGAVVSSVLSGGGRFGVAAWPTPGPARSSSLAALGVAESLRAIVELAAFRPPARMAEPSRCFTDTAVANPQICVTTNLLGKKRHPCRSTMRALGGLPASVLVFASHRL